jgi:lipoprotein-anchoring transpeptidase ErfK/SrfK
MITAIASSAARSIPQASTWNAQFEGGKDTNTLDLLLTRAQSPLQQGQALREIDNASRLTSSSAAAGTERGIIRFDGRTFTVFLAGSNKPSLEINAVSGRPGHQTSRHQAEVDRGPIPEGRYLVSQRRGQTITASDDVLGRFGRGSWPGGVRSWGFQRIWLTPIEGTNVMGRSGFSIHGGETPGSAGCVDLTTRMGDFYRLFRNANTDFVLVVDYGRAQ